MKKFLVFVFFFFVCLVSAQQIQDISRVKVDDLSDRQIEKFNSELKSRGYTIEQAEIMLKSRGMSRIEIDKLKTRIRKLSYKKREKKNLKVKDSLVKQENELIFGLTGNKKNKDRRIKKDSLYGYDFFNNPNITFTPNINVTVPKNYRLGKGDVVEIDVWGAAEANYQKTINKQGDIYIEGVGRIKLTGLDFEKAEGKIKSYLKRIYSGMNASNSSYSKVFVAVGLAKIRNVQVNLVGEVKTPGTYSLSSLSTVLNALYAAGGPTKEGDFRKISLVRGGTKIAEFDFYDYLTQGSEKGNLSLQDQDVIIVGAYQNLVKVLGEVKRPGYYQMKTGETMADLFRYAGGLTAEAFKNSVVVERIDGVEKALIEFNFDSRKSIKIANGDLVSVKKISNIFENKVSIKGAVKVEGAYEYKKGMTVGDLIKKASGLRKDAFLNRALITRYISSVDKKMIAVSLTDKNNILLNSNDEVFVYSSEDLREKQTVKIVGAVNKPQDFDYVQGMQIEDLIVMAGGFTTGADAKNIEVSRRKKDGGFQKFGEVFKFSSSDDLTFASKKFELKPFDVVYVRYVKGYTKQKIVKVTGEVTYPGEYLITSKDDRISDLIARSGGLSPFAFVEGATLIRKKKGVEKKQNDFLKELQQRDSILKQDIEKNEFRIGINLQRILKNKKSKEDLMLEDGDELIISPLKQTVEVRGEVYAPSLVQYIPGKSLKYYVNNAGGYMHFAKKNRTYVMYSNGNLGVTKSFLGIRKYPKIKPGATILVPKREQRRKVTAQEIIGITTGVATLGILIDRLVTK